MEDKLTKVQRNLYKREFQLANGEWGIRYYVNFVDSLKKKRRNFAVGEDLQHAKDELGRLMVLNKGRFDWDAERETQRKAKIKAMRLGEWLDKWLALKEGKPSHYNKTKQ